jgi:hypothetical protein
VSRTYLVERYWPGATEVAFNDITARARSAARELQAAGRNIEYLGGLLLPGDEVAFWRFASESDAGVAEAAARAGLTFDRVVESIEAQPDTDHK